MSDSQKTAKQNIKPLDGSHQVDSGPEEGELTPSDKHDLDLEAISDDTITKSLTCFDDNDAFSQRRQLDHVTPKKQQLSFTSAIVSMGQGLPINELISPKGLESYPSKVAEDKSTRSSKSHKCKKNITTPPRNNRKPKSRRTSVTDEDHESQVNTVSNHGFSEFLQMFRSVKKKKFRMTYFIWNLFQKFTNLKKKTSYFH